MKKMTPARSLRRAALVGGVVLLAAMTTQAAGPFQYFSVTPCRVFDTRDGGGPTAGAPLADQSTTDFTIQGTCNVPVGAKSITVNMTAVTPGGQGFLTLFPSDAAQPTVSSLNYDAGAVIGNGAIVGVSAATTLDLSLFAKVAGGGTVHVVLDVTGFFQ